MSAKLARDRELAALQVEAVKPPTPEELARQDAKSSLMKFVPWATPSYGEPRHLAPIVEAFERAVRGESLRLCFSAPPQNAKSDTIAHGVAWGLWQDLALRFGYATYGDALVRDKSSLARRVATERIGLKLEVKKLQQWDTAEGGGFIATSVRGAMTGKRVNIAVVDDPYKNRQEAESPTTRRTVRDFINDVIETRLTPNGSCFVFMTRWHDLDLIGELVKEGWKYVRLQALDDDTGKPLWPERWSREDLLKKRERVGEYTWESLYQGRPRARGATVFGPPHTYTKLPVVYRASFGVDLAYSAKTSSNWSVAVKVLHATGKFYVVDVLRRRVRAPAFKAACRELHLAELAASWRWYTSSTEQGTADLFRDGDEPVPLIAFLAKADKLTRAQPFAAAWNRGDVLVPKAAPWLETFLSEVASFTGVADPEDDQVDGAVAAFDELDVGPGLTSSTPTAPTRTGGLRATPL